MHRLSTCPVCEQTNFRAFLSCRDYTVSHETFSLEQCMTCGFVMTNPQPEQAELPRYYQSDAYISHSNKSQNLVDRAYKISRAFSIRWKYQLLKKHSLKDPETILDYGCGTGSFLEYCQRKGMQVAGVEPSSTARDIAINHTHAQVVADIDEAKNTFDVITLWHVLEHVSDLNNTLEKIKGKLGKNGTMFIAVPNLQSRDAKKYTKHWAAFDVPRHLWHFSKTTMTKLVEKHQLTLNDIVPMRLDAYYVSLLSEKYRTGTNGLTTMGNALTQGWKSNNTAAKTGEYSSLIYIVRK
jgi:2-polyprenyl-3-methyl-5-hydroxy-6-metoxy-1,4-benzoquinol methylase